MAATNAESLKKRTREISQKEVIEQFGKGPYKLNLGCGSDMKKGYINIDCLESADLQLDLEVARLPFPKGSVETVFAAHIFEHLHNFPALMNEIHRVLKPNGILQVHVPCYPAPEVFHDPTHVRVFTDKTFLYFMKGAFLHDHCGESYGYEGWNRLNQQKINGWELVARLSK